MQAVGGQPSEHVNSLGLADAIPLDPPLGGQVSASRGIVGQANVPFFGVNREVSYPSDGTSQSQGQTQQPTVLSNWHTLTLSAPSMSEAGNFDPRPRQAASSDNNLEYPIQETRQFHEQPRRPIEHNCTCAKCQPTRRRYWSTLWRFLAFGYHSSRLNVLLSSFFYVIKLFHFVKPVALCNRELVHFVIKGCQTFR